jgi:serine-type D-Ala-D-Ala carboxypeptidase/endopeptidase (penicillin-binding protein 4)
MIAAGCEVKRLRLKTTNQSWIVPLTAVIASTVAAIGSAQGVSAEAVNVPAIAAPPLTIPTPPIAPAASVNTKQGLCPSDLESTVNAIIDKPAFASARWGILITPLSSQVPLYKRNPDKSLIPASNIKLLTTAAALQAYSHESTQRLPHLEAWLQEINRYSDNNYADSLLNRIGGIKVARNALSVLGVSPESYHQVDGSGLSRSNLAKPATLVALLKTMYLNDTSNLFYNSLAIAGVSGTLRNRFHDTSVQGKIHAKTGTLSGVRALSGYLENADYGPIVFSIMVNQPGQSGEVLVKAIDQIMLRVARLTVCP